MRTTLILASLASLSSVALAQQNGYGRFPCTIVNGDGTFSPDQSQCANANLIAPGANTPEDTGNQGDGVTPVDPVCTIDSASGLYFCGIAGASCLSDANCDNGVCTTGTCTGGRNAACASDAECSGFLYCFNDLFEPASGLCGGLGAYCADYTQGSPENTAAENYPIFNSFCASGYCNSQTNLCDEHVTVVGRSCASDPEFACTVSGTTGQVLTCDAATLTCQVAAVPSGAARQRRNRILQKRNLCPANHSACSIQGGKGFECIDTQSNIEQCGACASAGGVDCTQIEGVEAVGCVAGTCEVWSCATNYEWSSSKSACVATLRA
ncbi:hypothetical protein JCM6882_002474 [Rhodosporidiobolus microsporus]